MKRILYICICMLVSMATFAQVFTLKDAWNFIVGGQFQFNKHFMIRGEVGFLGSRTQVMAGVQYRFGL